LFPVLLAGVVGLVGGWLLGRRRPGSDAGLIQELRRQLAARESEAGRVTEELRKAEIARATAAAAESAAQQMLRDQRTLQETTFRETEGRHAQALSDLRTAFKALSLDALRELQPQFLERVSDTMGKLQESARGDLAQRQQAISTMIEPLKLHLQTYQERLQQAEAQQAGALGEVKKQLAILGEQSQALALETQQFRTVLKSNQARGRWGEETLRRVIEAAGMSAHCDFTEQMRAGDAQPDLIVRLPADRLIIIDSKVPDLDFLSALGEAEPEKRRELLMAHAGRLKATIKSLADRDYPARFPKSLDYVVLFLPAESLFSSALEGDPELIVWAASKHILLATPASLIGLLRSVAVSWNYHAQTENAEQIAAAARELYSRLLIFSEHFDQLRDGLDRANGAFNNACASFQSRVRPAGERLAALGAGATGKGLPELDPLALHNPASLNVICGSSEKRMDD
jgi:DNA recombination protein RmuC